MKDEMHQVRIRVASRDLDAELSIERTEDWNGRGARLTVHCAAGVWSGLGGDIFTGLTALMQDMEKDGVLIGVAGARVNVWASGMQRDMGDGRSAYLLTIPRTRSRPERVRTLDPAPLDEVGSIAEKHDFHASWLASLEE